MARDPKDYNDNAEHCPSCGADLQGVEIEVDNQHLYGVTHFSRKLSIYVRNGNRVMEWACPDCEYRWDRA